MHRPFHLRRPSHWCWLVKRSIGWWTWIFACICISLVYDTWGWIAQACFALSNQLKHRSDQAQAGLCSAWLSMFFPICLFIYSLEYWDSFKMYWVWFLVYGEPTWTTSSGIILNFVLVTLLADMKWTISTIQHKFFSEPLAPWSYRIMDSKLWNIWFQIIFKQFQRYISL